jgi:hypothetical protein
MDKYQKADYDWLQCMMRIGRKETVFFEQDNTGYTEQIVSMNCRRSIMVWVYSTMINAKLLTPIELLDLEVKKQMWGFVNELCAGKEADKKRRIEIAKTFYIIEYFINETK